VLAINGAAFLHLVQHLLRHVLLGKLTLAPNPWIIILYQPTRSVGDEFVFSTAIRCLQSNRHYWISCRVGLYVHLPRPMYIWYEKCAYWTSICPHSGVILRVEVGGLGEACGPSTAPPATCYHPNAFLHVHIRSKCQEKGEGVSLCQHHWAERQVACSSGTASSSL